MRKFLGVAAAVMLFAGPALAQNTLRWASQGDGFTLDPHAQNEGQTHTINRQMMEPLVERRPDLTKIPALALSWSLVNPTTWEFKLRPGVKFHDGRPFSADDVVFSFQRAMAPTSDVKEVIGTLKSVAKVDALTVRFTTTGPDPIFPDEITNLYIMSKGWAEEHKVTTPQDTASKQETYAVRHANGTGPFKLELREPDVRTVMVKNPEWWGLADPAFKDLNVDRIVFTPVANAATRVAALLSGELDFLLDPPVQDIARIESSGQFTLQRAPEVRSIFLGMRTGTKELATSSVKGKNPFADIRVRRAMNMAVDVNSITKRIMRGQAQPAGYVVPPGVHGYHKDLDQHLPFDVDGAKKLLTEAGYPSGFDVRLDCSNDRYINDEEVCQAVTGMLARIGVKVNLDLKPRTLHFPRIQNDQSDFYLLGWGTLTTDAHYHLAFLGLPSTWNRTGFRDQKMEDLINALGVETDVIKRDVMIREASVILRDAYATIPLHTQYLTWATRKGVNVPITADNLPSFRYARFVK
jgi:peptide/nickel transport system substrate-binding protein